ncbi:hypothetical protein K435DRAFT_377221 [Dendrothele bispora CBS 962.96]|uniref:Nucleic acid-binding protein n=1 Tax=Dendrothele bispora (strain CBS 962.96) TaxID=1314807 RepID=A0A4S8MGZ7_DENBC|nr:hypothetical protein K435DRAFT_377221 [Dendrothele bispora CBS 962.96]
MYRIFLGAPTVQEVLQQDRNGGSAPYNWVTISSDEPTTSQHSSSDFSGLLLPPATLEAASRRISLIYQNIIFQDKDEDEDIEDEESFRDETQDFEDLDSKITWDPTLSYHDRGSISKTKSFINTSIPAASSRFQTQTQFGTQYTQESQSYDHSDTSSIARFPQFHFSLHILTSLPSLQQQLGAKKGGPSIKVNLLLAVLEVEGPDTIRTKKGPDAGKEISILKMILGDEEGNVCKLTAWREIAETWGGSDEDSVGVKRGDVVLVQNVTATCEPKTSPSLSASPFLKSKLEICYRTMPYTHEDMRLRPDLRLGGMDACVRKVAAVVRWFEKMAGLKF